MVSRSQTYAPGYVDLALGGAEPEAVKSLCILGVAFDSKLSFERLWTADICNCNRSYIK